MEMRKVIVCLDCKRKRLHKAFGLCDSCYQCRLRRKQKDRIKIENKRYWLKNKYKINTKRRENYNDFEKLKTVCKDKIRTALKNNTIIKPKFCMSCKKKKVLDAHHDDYSKPLDVIWLCKSCHKIKHSNLNKRFPLSL